MELPTPRARRPALALAAALLLGTAACNAGSEPDPSSPATSVSPESSAQRTDANSVPPGVSGQGSGGGEGDGGGSSP